MWLECCLWVIGLVALTLCGLVWYQARETQRQASRELDRLLLTPTPSVRQLPGKKLPKGAVVGRLEIPRLKLESMILEGTDENTLGRGIGHLSQSPLPHAPGNIVLAAHRDTFFNPLEKIQPNDEIAVTTPEGTRHWVVESTAVVAPTETSVLRPSKTPLLTLVTCYPFRFIGPAPKRFIVRARELVRPT